MTEKFDYIIAGGGCSGLSLAYRMSQDAFFDDKNIAIIEQDTKNKNDRTWCHWSTEDSIFDPVVHKSWKQIYVFGKDLEITQNISPFTYKMIRGIDFYEYVKPKILQAPNIHWIQDKIVSLEESKDAVTLITEQNQFLANHIFKSFSKHDFTQNAHSVIQHFKGYFVKTDEYYFDENSIRFMDFRTPQNNEVRFFYVLPTSKREALIEVAIFSNEILKSEDYDVILTNYINAHLPGLKFIIEEEEMGAIPMTTYNFKNHDTDQVTHIGTAGGIVKPSSGYAFERIQKHTKAIVEALKKGKHPQNAQIKFGSKYKFYDEIFMNVLLTNKADGDQVFMDMFKKLPARLILKFLNEETSFSEELRLFTAPPTLPFLKAFIEEVKS